MGQAAQSAYIETQVRTATPQKLRLMLIDGALRFAHRTIHHWEQQENEQAFETLLRCRGIIVELLTTVRADESEVARQVVEIYAILLHALTEAQAARDRHKVEQVIRTLEIERETWQQVCEQMPDAPDEELRQSRKPREITAAGMQSIPPRGAGASTPLPLDAQVGSADGAGRFSLDA